MLQVSVGPAAASANAKINTLSFPQTARPAFKQIAPATIVIQLRWKTGASRSAV
jgi:hypothetical protein